jgi:hypothetical protein
MRFNRKSVIVTESNDSPAVSLADMKAYLRVDTSGDNDLITGHTNAATEAIKQYLRSGLLTETFEFRMDGFSDGGGDARLMAYGGGVHTASVPHVLGGGDWFDLPFVPLQSVTSVVTYDRDNTGSTVDASKYEVDLQGGRVYLNEGETWPVNLRDKNAVLVTYVAGYGSGSIPSPIEEAIKMYVSQLYDGTCAGIDEAMRRMLTLYRRMDDLAYG